MAFGKDKRTMSTVGSFRQMSNQLASHKGGRRSHGGIPYFVDMYRPSTTEIDTIRLVPGEYLQDQIEGDGDNAKVVQSIMAFIKFVEHFDGTMQKGTICSAGPFANDKNKRAPCHGCDIFWDTVVRNEKGRLESTRISRQNKYAFSVLDYGRYHKMDQYDTATGQPKINPTTKQPYFNWVKCQGQGCDACRANIETKFGNMSHWPINFTQLQVLRSAEVDIGKSCVVCGTENSIGSLGWECPNCGECAIDMATTQMKLDELLKMTDEHYTCPSCAQTGFLHEVYECRACTPRGHTGVRSTLFDVDLRVKVVETGGNNGKVLQVLGWSAPRPIPTEFAEVAKPVDLVARYAPDPLDRQAQKFGISAAPKREPQTGSQPAARQYTNPYGNKPTQ
jgi:hypothetical protein